MKKLSIREFAQKTNLSVDIVTRLVKQKIIRGEKKNPFAVTSKIFIPESEVEKVKRAREQA